MVRPCTICVHKDKRSIEDAILAGESVRHIAVRCGTSSSTIQRHKAGCMALQLQKASARTEVKEISQGERFLRQLESIAGKCVRLLEEAEQEKDRSLQLAAIRESRESLNSLLKWTTPSGPEVAVAVQVNTGALALGDPKILSYVLKVLDRHPEAKKEIMEAISRDFA